MEYILTADTELPEVRGYVTENAAGGVRRAIVVAAADTQRDLVTMHRLVRCGDRVTGESRGSM